jgi:hypothetical protein
LKPMKWTKPNIGIENSNPLRFFLIFCHSRYVLRYTKLDFNCFLPHSFKHNMSIFSIHCWRNSIYPVIGSCPDTVHHCAFVIKHFMYCMTFSVKILLKELLMYRPCSFIHIFIKHSSRLERRNLQYLKLYSLFLIVVLMLVKYHMNSPALLFPSSSKWAAYFCLLCVWFRT